MTILQSLDRYYERMAARGDVTPHGWSMEPVGVVVVLDGKGTIVRVFDRLDEKRKKGLPTRVPKWFGRSGQGSTPFLFWDNTAYALGVSTKDPGKTGRDHEAFRKLHFDLLADQTDEGLVALRRFLEHWSPDQFTAPHFRETMTAFNVVFQLDGSERESTTGRRPWLWLSNCGPEPQRRSRHSVWSGATGFPSCGSTPRSRAFPARLRRRCR